MTDIKKEQEREELHRAIWAIADELRGAVDGWDFKNYVLGTMFYRFISEDLTNYINQMRLKQVMLTLIMLRCPTRMQRKPAKVLSKKRAFLCCPANSSAMFVLMQPMTRTLTNA